MADLSDDYQRQLVALLPSGPAWSDSSDLLAALAPTISRTHERLLQLLEEADPRSSVELFARWEALNGLPDACVAAADRSMSQRRADLVAKVTFKGSLSKQFFIDVAAALGFVITIDEYEPYRVEQPVEQPLLGEEWYFVWQVNTTAVGAEEPFRVETSSVEDLLVAYPTNAVLECLFGRLKPAHTYLLFAYA